ncbi:MAG TPA: ATP-binding protein [Gemmatimonadales bacterium]|nr:ATP-binding protein [Gemmatimonadales bacterium]
MGTYFILAAAILIVPGLLLAERSLRRRLQAERLTALKTAMGGVVFGIHTRVAAAEARVARFSSLISREGALNESAGAAEFDRLVVRDADSAWRSRKSLFDPATQAGIFLPKGAPVDPVFKSFLVRAKRVTEQFGSGTLDPTLADAWISPDEGGQVMYVPDQPTFVWELTATEDYHNTDWMRLATTAVNPTGVPRWADPFHSVKTDAWFVSVVAPFTRLGRWGGSVGQDLSWAELVDYSAQTPLQAGGRFLIIGRNGGVLLADSNTTRSPSRPGGRTLKDLPDLELRDTLTRLLAQVPAGSPGAEPAFIRTSDAYVLWAAIPRTGWLVASVLPATAVETPIRAPLRTMRFAVLFGLGVLLVASLLAITREIRRRRTIEEETQRAEERFRSLFQLDPDGVMVTLIDSGEVIEVNDSAVDLTGFSREEMMGRSVLELRLWGRLEQRQQVLEQVRRDTICRDVPVLMRRKDGRTMDIEYSGRLIEVDGKRCLLSILRDVDEQRALEQKLTQSQKMEAIGRLAGGVAHDFNNIMTAVMGYGQIASESLPPDAPAQDDLKEILRAVGRASELTRQLLAFARRQVTVARPVSLNVLVLETRKLLERLLGEDVVLIHQLTEHLPSVQVDPGQIEQVLVNLSVNARDAMPKGGVLTIVTGVQGADVVLDVTDTGVGIPPEQQASIFEPFFTTKEHGKGTGLGLATCYGIVRQAGGRIELRSEPGIGSRFRVLLPALPEGTLPIHTPAQGTRIESLAPRGGETILLAEDEPQVRQLALRLLRGLGYQVFVAESGEMGLAVAQRIDQRIDLLVTDVVMPGMTGEELASQLRRTRPDLRVLYISGYAEDSDAIERALREGDAFLPKPFSVSGLARQVRDVLDRPS